MAEDKKEPWVNYMALTTVILAVCATLSTFKGGGFSTKSVISQAKASDQWAYYQAKAIKGNLYQVQKEQIELQLSTLPSNTSEDTREKLQHKADDYAKKVEKYDGEKKEIEKTARDFEDQRDDAQKHGAPFGKAVIFLQVAILISSIAGLLKKKQLWFAALPVGGVGMLFFVDGFYLFM
ncbi:DUF4337 domain-containing protein [Burkholderiaceae bacterium DAT-1]|nr:DUF4337 domain-containing protein [Burkholderiaceae bacterium DAT-1]